ncbi:MAG TPA: hypothetical protein VFS43_01510 [Polyangiaceae bacterium]|nr:hypothetical protein [Polyangiaceae bacterium]
MALPLGKSELGAVVERGGLGVRLRGNVAAEQVPLYPAKPSVVAGVVVTGGATALRWEATGARGVSMRLPASRRVRLAEQARAVSWPCEAVGLEEGRFDEGDARGLPPLGAMRPAKLRLGAGVPIADAPGGAVRATIEAGTDDPNEPGAGG